MCLSLALITNNKSLHGKNLNTIWWYTVAVSPEKVMMEKPMRLVVDKNYSVLVDDLCEVIQSNNTFDAANCIALAMVKIQEIIINDAKQRIGINRSNCANNPIAALNMACEQLFDN